MRLPLLLAAASAFSLIACAPPSEGVETANGNARAAPAARPANGRPFQVEELGRFVSPWAMTFLPGGEQALVTEKGGRLILWSRGGRTEVGGVPRVDAGGQGGLGDVVLHPDFARNNMVYLSWVEAGERDTRGAVVGRGRLVFTGNAAPDSVLTPRIEGIEIVWRQTPKREGRGHFAHRIAFGPDGKLYISSGDRQAFDPAQDMSGNLGKILRLNDDGSVPSDNPWANLGGVTAQIWTLGHRNPLGLAFDGDRRLWVIEMGPKGGDELNLIQRGRNYGYPIVSNGDHYDGRPIPDHRTRPEFEAPKVDWTPVISPGNMLVYTGAMFPGWRGDALVAGLSSEALVHIDLNGTTAREAHRYPMGERIREVEQAPDGSIYVLEDGGNARLLRLTAAR